ncbi:helix-turn-helix domain-containing protein [Paenibacillus ihuae]|uniref:helix-turn-helix domain-containing protein n=1 Tax=Paenibacillus ihuae TaxID=1232431 RepID=UPI0006D59147|nr:helix-turn-helix domain-containing protein [Paenibacillus ihuae]
MSEKKNLKDGSAKLRYYREKLSGNRIPKTRIVRGKEQSYFEEELERLYFDEEVVRNISLDKYSQNIPYVDGHLTIINNYMFDYWGYLLGAEGIALYAHLKRYCYGEKDYCWPNLELISHKMKMSRNTVKKYLNVLESYGFVITFNVQNADNNNTNESPLFKMRKKVPLLSQEQCAQLPKILQDDHDKYLRKLMTTSEQQLELDPSVNYDEFFISLEQKGTVYLKPKQMSLFEAEKQSGISRRLLQEEQTKEDQARWTSVLDQISKIVSRPSYDNWFKGTFAINQSGTLIIYTPHNLVTEWLETRYQPLIMEVLSTIDNQIQEIKIKTVL